MRNLLIGSRALNYWCPEHKIKDTTDWDVISDEAIEGTEHHQANHLNNYKLERFTNDLCTVEFNGSTLHVVSPAGLALIKRSHLWRDLSFDKHITMYHNYLHLIKEQNLYSRDYVGLLAERTELTMKAYPQQGPNLNMPIAEFFDDAVTKKYSHDWLHKLYAYEDAPLYTKLQKDSLLAMCHKELWYNLTRKQKLQCVAEETYVIATERFLVPNNWDYSAKRAYFAALKKVSTTLCKGWFRDFAIDNYPDILKLFDQGKVDRVKSIVESNGSNHLFKT
jgi:hypothetical protein